MEVGHLEYGKPLTTGTPPNILHVYSDYITEQIKATKILNPFLEIRIRNETEAKNDIKNFCPQMISLYLKLKYHAHKSDVWRNCILYEMGKYYIS